MRGQDVDKNWGFFFLYKMCGACFSRSHLMWRWFEVGSPSGPLLILLHGVCGSAANFFQQLIALRYKVNTGCHGASGMRFARLISYIKLLCLSQQLPGLSLRALFGSGVRPHLFADACGAAFRASTWFRFSGRLSRR